MTTKKPDIKKKVEAEVKKEVHKVEIEKKKEIKEVKKEAKEEIKKVAQERDHLQKLLNEVIANQTSSKIRDYVNIAFWIVCFTLLILQSLGGQNVQLLH